MREWYEDAMHQPFSLTGDEITTSGALLVHGFTGSPADMRPMAEALRPHGLDAHVLMLPGMAADIEQLNEMTAEIWQDAVAQRWAKHRAQYERTVLVGYSMGGALSLIAAAEHPPDLLILIAPLTRLADPRAIFLPVIKHVKRGMRPYAHLDWDSPKVHEWFDRARPSMRTRDPVNRAFLQHEAFYSTRMLDELRRLLAYTRRVALKVNVPTVIVQGIDDRIVLKRHTRELITRIGGPVSYRELPGDHYLPLPSFDGWSRFKGIIDGELCAWSKTTGCSQT